MDLSNLKFSEHTSTSLQEALGILASLPKDHTLRTKYTFTHIVDDVYNDVEIFIPLHQGWDMYFNVDSIDTEHVNTIELCKNNIVLMDIDDDEFTFPRYLYPYDSISVKLTFDDKKNIPGKVTTTFSVGLMHQSHREKTITLFPAASGVYPVNYKELKPFKINSRTKLMRFCHGYSYRLVNPPSVNCKISMNHDILFSTNLSKIKEIPVVANYSDVSITLDENCDLYLEPYIPDENTIFDIDGNKVKVVEGVWTRC